MIFFRGHFLIREVISGNDMLKVRGHRQARGFPHR